MRYRSEGQYVLQGQPGGSPWFLDTIVLCQHFLQARLRLPLSPLSVSFFNYVQRMSQPFDAPYFLAMVVFDYINVHPKLESGELGLEQFLYYFHATKSSGNNRPTKSPQKRSTKVRSLKLRRARARTRLRRSSPLILIIMKSGSFVTFQSPCAYLKVPIK